MPCYSERGLAKRRETQVVVRVLAASLVVELRPVVQLRDVYKEIRNSILTLLENAGRVAVTSESELQAVVHGSRIRNHHAAISRKNDRDFFPRVNQCLRKRAENVRKAARLRERSRL